MRVLIGCECSGAVRRAFRDRGHDAWSCDLQAADDASPFHIQGDVMDILKNEWDIGIFHPPCTFLCGMGIWWNHKRPERWVDTFKALEFVKALWSANIPRIAIENPIGYLSKNFRKPDQIINPWQFGDEANKPTCLWLNGLPKLTPTKIVGKGEFYTKKNGARMSKWSHITSGTRKDQRAKIAATTFQGIANAMAEQWSNIP
jgi:hypothetical protein